MIPHPARPCAERGYILFEAMIALTVLSVSIYVIQDGIRQAVIARGHAQDFTQARFLMEDMVNRLQLQPVFKEENKSGRFRGKYNRFSWSYTITKVDLPVPPPPPTRTTPYNQPGGQPQQGPQNLNYPRFPGYQREYAEGELELPVPFLGKIEATVSWTRSGMPFEVKAQTLFAPERMWLPPPPDPLAGPPGLPPGLQGGRWPQPQRPQGGQFR